MESRIVFPRTAEHIFRIPIFIKPSIRVRARICHQDVSHNFVISSSSLYVLGTVIELKVSVIEAKSYKTVTVEEETTCSRQCIDFYNKTKADRTPMGRYIKV